MKLNRILAACGLTAAMALSAGTVSAQDDGGQGGRRGPRGGDFDPAQAQQRVMEMYKERLGFTDDTEWTAVQPLIQKVVEARREVGGGAMGRFARVGGGGGGGGGGRGFGAVANPEADALRRSIEANAPAAQIKDALDKYRAAQKARDEKLEKAQADLQKVLTAKQEAAAVLAGLLK